MLLIVDKESAALLEKVIDHALKGSGLSVLKDVKTLFDITKPAEKFIIKTIEEVTEPAQEVTHTIHKKDTNK